MFRSRTWLVQETLLPVLSVSAFAFSYRWMNAPPVFVGFVILGAAMTTFWLNVLWSMGVHLYWERDARQSRTLHHGPGPHGASSRAWHSAASNKAIARAAAIVGAGVLLFDVPLHPSSPVALRGRLSSLSPL